MAYHDENGIITIDEVAAQGDVKKIKDICNALRDSQKTMRRIHEQSYEFKGKTATALAEISGQFVAKYESLIQELEDTSNYILATVKKYQRIDEQLKNTIDGSR